jgi:hypothetical protein
VLVELLGAAGYRQLSLERQVLLPQLLDLLQQHGQL